MAGDRPDPFHERELPRRERAPDQRREGGMRSTRASNAAPPDGTRCPSILAIDDRGLRSWRRIVTWAGHVELRHEQRQPAVDGPRGRGGAGIIASLAVGSSCPSEDAGVACRRAPQISFDPRPATCRCTAVGDQGDGARSATREPERRTARRGRRHAGAAPRGVLFARGCLRATPSVAASRYRVGGWWARRLSGSRRVRGTRGTSAMAPRPLVQPRV